MSELNPKEAIAEAVAELDQALYMHEEWSEEISAALICHMKPDERDIRPDAHRLCRFGQWYYGTDSNALRNQTGFTEVETEHRRMHEFAASLLRASADGRQIAPQDYQRFVSAMKRTRLEIQTLKRQLEISLYNIDPLTGVPGRVEMLRKVREQQDFVARGVHACAVAMLDVDCFKAVNDTYGHSVGDSVLVDICRHIQSNLRSYDMVFRYGGEEFLLCLPNLDAPAGHDICERLRAELETTPHHSSAGERFPVTVSIGVTALDPALPVEEAIDRADRALLSAKARGRNRTVLWDKSMIAN